MCISTHNNQVVKKKKKTTDGFLGGLVPLWSRRCLIVCSGLFYSVHLCEGHYLEILLVFGHLFHLLVHVATIWLLCHARVCFIRFLILPGHWLQSYNYMPIRLYLIEMSKARPPRVTFKIHILNKRKRAHVNPQKGRKDNMGKIAGMRKE